jgi:hypothetical protein
MQALAEREMWNHLQWLAPYGQGTTHPHYYTSGVQYITSQQRIESSDTGYVHAVLAHLESAACKSSALALRISSCRSSSSCANRCSTAVRTAGVTACSCLAASLTA